MATREYTFKRTSKGREFATVTGESREQAENSIHYNDIMDHEDYEWGDWQLVEVVEYTDDGDVDVSESEELDEDPERSYL
jgi:hypothetical protein